MYSFSGKSLFDERVIFSETEKRLITAIIPIIHRWWDRPDEIQEKGLPGYIFHNAQSPFELSSDIMWCLGLAVAGSSQYDLKDVTFSKYEKNYRNASQKIDRSHFLLKAVSKDQIPYRIRFDRYNYPYSLFNILCSFIDHGADYGGKLPVNRNQTFNAPDRDIENAIEALVESHYAEKSNAGYVWTDKIAPVMIASHTYWTWDEFKPDSVDHDNCDNIMCMIEDIGIHKIPRIVYNNYAGAWTNREQGLAFCIMRHWRGTGWCEIGLDDPQVSFDDALVIARYILENYKHSEDRTNHSWVRIE